MIRRGERDTIVVRKGKAVLAEEVVAMPMYLWQGSYTAESLTAQIKQPQDRIEAVRPALEALGVKIITGGFSFGDYDIAVILEAPDDTTVASVALTLGAGGAVRAGKTTRLLSGHEWVEALRKAQNSQYRPAR
jgi:uncharacterized protein with GYD domain